MKRAYYADSIMGFLQTPTENILGKLTENTVFGLETTQRDAWMEQISILKRVLPLFNTGTVLFEYSIPRMGRRIDVVLIIESVIFVLEFKVGEKDFTAQAVDQTWDYALDLKNFHETSHDQYIAPVLIATKSRIETAFVAATPQNDKLLLPIKCDVDSLSSIIEGVLSFADGKAINGSVWQAGRYCPTPTIIEAAMALYNGHAVQDISRSDASAINLSQTSDAISAIIRKSKEQSQKSICFVTGVPGAGKTLVGLNIATNHIEKSSELYSVFLSGNGPLVAILREALARDKVTRAKEQAVRIKKGEALSEVKAFIQNVHHFRDDCLSDLHRPPIEHVALFDEAQRAWDLKQTTSFMLSKRKNSSFTLSEPEFLISCMDRHPDWAVIVCLVGGGQEIHKGEAGIGEWIESVNRSFPEWHVYLSTRLTDSEYTAGNALQTLRSRDHVTYHDNLHLAVSMRSFRAEDVSLFVKQLLDRDIQSARQTLSKLEKYPIVITRNLDKAKQWLKLNFDNGFALSYC